MIKGEMELGKIAPEPTGGTEDLGVYRGAFKSSVAWLSAFATADRTIHNLPASSQQPNFLKEKIRAIRNALEEASL